MTATCFDIEAVDAWFFRDGRPFNALDPAQSVIASMFPPPPATCVGALRAAIARANGWSGQGDWPEPLHTLVGNRDDLGPLRFRGPYVVRNGDVLYPAPLHLVRISERGRGERARQRLDLLTPGPARRCDLTENVRVRLPALTQISGRIEPLAGFWLTTSGLSRVLAGDAASDTDVVSRTEVSPDEPRTGLQRRADTGTADPGFLYSIRVTRPCPKTGLAVVVEGLSDFPSTLSNPVAFGGEGRMAWLTKGLRLPALPAMPPLQAEGQVVRYTATLVTPFDQGPADVPRPDGALPDLPGVVVSACVGRAVPIGGWRSTSGDQGPRPLKPVTPAGSMWFLEAPADKLSDIARMHGRCIGERADWGMGQVVIGRWPRHTSTA